MLGIANLNGLMWNGLGYFASQQSYQIHDDASFVTARHNIRFGGEVQRYRNDTVSYYLSGGFAQFQGNLTSIPGKANLANSWAEFLLGDLGTWQQESYWSERNYIMSYNLYAQDNIRLMPKLTVNAGIRWEPRFPYNEIQGKETTFIPGVQSKKYPNAPLGIVFPGDPGVGGNVNPNRPWNFAPRLGIAYQLEPATVIRAAFGLFYDAQIIGDNNPVASNPPFVTKAICSPCAGPLSNPLGPAPSLQFPRVQGLHSPCTTPLRSLVTLP